MAKIEAQKRDEVMKESRKSKSTESFINELVGLGRFMTRRSKAGER
jgi:hypothetical protein